MKKLILALFLAKTYLIGLKMKRLLLIFILVFSGAWGEESNDSQWKSYFGVEGGVGMMNIFTAFIFGANTFNTCGLVGLSYGGGILGGWQKYTYEKVGMRNTLGLRVFGAKNLKAKQTEYEKYEKDFFADVTFYYALDGLFDFVKNGENRFGMSLGFSTDLLQLTESNNLFGLGLFFRFSPRLGLYTQFGNHVIDLIASVPLIGMGGGEPAYNSTVTLGYKYLF